MYILASAPKISGRRYKTVATCSQEQLENWIFKVEEIFYCTDRFFTLYTGDIAEAMKANSSYFLLGCRIIDGPRHCPSGCYFPQIVPRQ